VDFLGCFAAFFPTAGVFAILIEGGDRFLKRNCEQSREEERTEKQRSSS
jgi:hypothetical protein